MIHPVTARVRQVLFCLTAFAVFVVGATCTSAGCLLMPVMAPSSATGAEKSCCAMHRHSQSPGAPSPEQSPGTCPACNQTLFSGDSLVKASLQLQANLLHAALPPALAAIAPSPVSSPTFLAAFENPPPTDPPSLLSLHCSLVI
jgi:hypothetical protein